MTEHSNNKMDQLDAWIATEQGKHICACGCGVPITILRHHYIRGIPKYLRGHSAGKFVDLDKWVADQQDKHFCQCGCGEVITIRREHHGTRGGAEIRQRPLFQNI